MTDSARPGVGRAAGGGSSGRYSLAGIQHATTAPHEAFIAKAREVLSEDERVLAAYVVGGFAVGMGDAFSDVDLHVVITDEAADELAESWRDFVQHIAPTVSTEAFGWANPARPRSQAIGGVCITPDWLHFDVVFRPASSIDARAIEGMVPLLDKAGLLPSGPTPRPDRRSEPFYPEAAVYMFLYMLGNVVAAIGRDEPIPASNGVIMLRDVCLVGLLLAEQGIASTRERNVGNPFPFTKRLRSYLTDEQNAILESLPPIAPSIESAIDGYVALAEIFIPRAKRLAQATGTRWPVEFEHASVSYFEKSVGVQLAL